MDVFLANRFTYQSRSLWRKTLEEGKILVQGKIAKASYLLKEGEEILYLPGEIEEPEVQREFKVLYEDERFFAVEKPGDLPVHGAGRYRKNNLVDIIEVDPRFQRPYLIHRLDRETSGVVLFGKDPDAAFRGSDLFANRKIRKTYIAYVWGSFPKKKKAIGFLFTDPSSQIRKKRAFAFEERRKDLQVPEEELESSETSFLKLGEGMHQGKVFSKLLCLPKTGRLHQIRATLFSLGYPLLGDKIYGKDETVFIEFIQGEDPDLISRLGMSRQALHSRSLSFVHPFLKKRIRILCPLPEDFPK
ncbi:RluA family pseudouridine synthase [Leptospira langatensis]|uniref:RluA family pseudouridine synthase n=1 Tax=Leptospira langatensis TaxID=2484983 RepID=A0A5F1ZR13_9LEPT|nr:RluA family pseudouridine synthase [Leptospira langatensis]TGK05334.1 RluA family pseudouridine synthase [Leptospira langatensis]TGL38470.1 RluA family pseudouridine synthase [Leptospira langatensis]